MFNLIQYLIASFLLCGLDLILMKKSYKKLQEIQSLICRFRSSVIFSGFTQRLYHPFWDKLQILQMNIKSLSYCSLNRKNDTVNYNSKSTPGWGAHLKPLFQMNWRSFSLLTTCCSFQCVNRINNFNRSSNNESYDRIAVLLDFLKAGIVRVNCMFQKVHGQSLKMNRVRYLRVICTNTFKSYLFVC